MIYHINTINSDNMVSLKVVLFENNSFFLIISILILLIALLGAVFLFPKKRSLK